VCIVVVVLCVLLSYVYLLYSVGIAFFFLTLDAGLLPRSQYPEGLATGHLDAGFSCLKTNAETAPQIPSCHYMLLI